MIRPSTEEAIATVIDAWQQLPLELAHEIIKPFLGRRGITTIDGNGMELYIDADDDSFRVVEPKGKHEIGEFAPNGWNKYLIREKDSDEEKIGLKVGPMLWTPSESYLPMMKPPLAVYNDESFYTEYIEPSNNGRPCKWNMFIYEGVSLSWDNSGDKGNVIFASMANDDGDSTTESVIEKNDDGSFSVSSDEYVRDIRCCDGPYKPIDIIAILLNWARDERLRVARVDALTFARRIMDKMDIEKIKAIQC